MVLRRYRPEKIRLSHMLHSASKKTPSFCLNCRSCIFFSRDNYAVIATKIGEIVKSVNFRSFQIDTEYKYSILDTAIP